MSDNELEGDHEEYDGGSYQIEELNMGGMPPVERHNNLEVRMERAPPPPTEGGAPPQGMRMTGGGNPSCNTGPKGVLADFEEAKRNMRTKRMMQDIRTERVMNKMAEGDLKLHVADEEKKGINTIKKSKKKKGGDDDEESDSDLDSDDDVMVQMRLKRIQAMQNTMPVFGTHDRVESIVDFSNLTKNVHEQVFVVAHLYENHLEPCVRINLAMEELASQFPHVRFVRLRSTDFLASYPLAGLPTFLIYKGGKEVATYLGDVVLREISPVTDANVARFLARRGVLSLPTGDDDNKS
jgi:thiol-disulfide isomerase/thioredoxin